jgi:hypothetical protein
VVLVNDALQEGVIVRGLYPVKGCRFDLYVLTEEEVAVAFCDAGGERVDDVLARAVTYKESLAADVPVGEAADDRLVLLVERAATLNPCDSVAFTLQRPGGRCV